MASLQYDLGGSATVAAEQALAPLLAQWIVQQSSSNISSPLYGRVDSDQLVVGGHSRGGKLAALVFTGE